jgi:arabinose-5-phosphate isomerase
MPTPDEVLALAAEAIRTASERNAGRWEAAVQALSPAGAIWCTGLGKSGLVAQKLAATLRSFGRPAHFLHPVEALHGDAGGLTGDDALVAISASGRTAELLRLLRDTPLPLVAITNPSTPLGGLAGTTLDASVDAEAGGLAPITSFLVATALADTLALQLRVGDALVHRGGYLGLAGRSVRSLMQPPPLVAPGTPVVEVIPRLGHGAVLLEGGGIFTDGDLRRAVGADPAALHRPVGELATAEPVTVRADERASVALDLMERRASQLAVLPVVDGAGHYVGLLRLHDLVRAGLGE